MPPIGWLWSPSRARQLLQCPALFFCHRRNIPAFCCLELCIQKAETYYMNIQTHHVDNQLHALLRMLPSTVLFCNSSIKSSVLPTQETKRNKRGTNSRQQKLCQTKSRQNSAKSKDSNNLSKTTQEASINAKNPNHISLHLLTT